MGYLVMFEKPGVINGKYVRKYMVESESDLSNLPSDTSPGSIAYTQGYVDRWEFGINGEWTRISNVGGGGSADLDYIFGSDSGLPYIQEV